MDPTTELSLAIHSRPGVYALLLGSGISTAAGIPTGWGVLEDLIRRVAVAQGEESPDDPAKWYFERTGKSADYSAVIEQLARTRSERQQLLRPYFEPSDNEDEARDKQPTKAHRAIARLMKSGHIRLALTVNFDRLLEQALDAEGVAPLVLTDEHSISGMAPLQHASGPVIAKLHGDYLDTRLRNTNAEIGEPYPDSIARLLDRVFDEYGMVVCGWSVKYDHALRDRYLSGTSRRYSTFWIEPFGLSNEAQELVTQRDARLVEADADSAFESIEESVRALDSMTRTVPLSAELVIQRAKLAIDAQRLVQLQDLISRECEQTATAIDSPTLAWNSGLTPASYVERTKRLVALSGTIVPLCATVAYHAPEQLQRQIPGILHRLQSSTRTSTRTYDRRWQYLAMLPAAFTFYGTGIGFLAADRLDLVADTLRDTRCHIGYHDPEGVPLCFELGWHCVFNHDMAQWLLADDFDGSPPTYQTPGSNFAFEVLPPMLRHVIPDNARVQRLFDELEIIVAASGGNLGRWIWKQERPLGGTDGPRLSERLAAEADSLGENHPWVQAGLFEDAEAVRRAAGRLAQQAQSGGY